MLSSVDEHDSTDSDCADTGQHLKVKKRRQMRETMATWKMTTTAVAAAADNGWHNSNSSDGSGGTEPKGQQQPQRCSAKGRDDGA